MPVNETPRRYRLIEDDPGFGMTAGDILVCVPYWLDPMDKLTVLHRERDGFNPGCNVYRHMVEMVHDGTVTALEPVAGSAAPTDDQLADGYPLAVAGSATPTHEEGGT